MTKSFAEQVHETLSGTGDRNHVYVGRTTSILKQLGSNDLPMLIIRGYLRDIHHEKVEGITKYHGLSEDTINKLPDILNNPAIVFDSLPDKNSDAVCILLSITDDDGLPIMVIIKSDGKGQYNNVEIDSNFILSMYGKDNPQGFLNEINKNIDKVLYINKIKTKEMIKGARLYLPASLNNLQSNTIIKQSKNVVKRKIEEKSEKGKFLISEDGAETINRESHKFSDEWNEKLEEYGAIPKGEKAKRNIDVPNQISERKYVSGFARTMLEAGVTPDFAVSEFEKSILDGTMTHEVITDKAAAKSA